MNIDDVPIVTLVSNLLPDSERLARETSRFQLRSYNKVGKSRRGCTIVGFCNVSLSFS